MFRTVSPAESDAARWIEVKSWIFGFVVVLVLAALVRGSSYFFWAIFVTFMVFFVWQVMGVDSKTSSDWPRWTDKAPW